MARRIVDRMSRKICFGVVIGILTTFAGMGTAMAAPEEPTEVPSVSSSPTEVSATPSDAEASPSSIEASETPTLTMPVAAAATSTPTATETEDTPIIGVDSPVQTDVAPTEQGIDSVDEPIATADDTPDVDVVDLSQIPYSASPIQNPDMARNPVHVDPGTPVPHDFDVVVANVYLASESLPTTTAPQTVSTEGIQSILGLAAGWWSTQTQLDFSFNVTQDNIRSINTTCANINRDALAAYGYPFNARPYTDSNRDLLILETRNACGNYSGIALTVAYPGNVAQGGIFRMWTSGWTGSSSQYDYRAAVLAHEFGHTIGLLHSNIRDCAALSLYGDDTIGLSWNGSYLTNPTDCVLREYADTTTIMAAASTLQGSVSLNALQRWYLGVARESTTILNPGGGATLLTLARADIPPDDQLPSEAVRGAVVPFTTDDYTLGIGLEYRWPRGVYDLSSGVYITSGLGDTGLQSDLLVPVAAGRGTVTTLEQPLNVGDVAVSNDGRVRIQVISQTESTAMVLVSIGAQPGVSGGVAITRTDRTLTALAASTQATSTTYQWMANGVAIAGATSPTYTPPVGANPNTVYRVEATMRGDGRGPTTRYSRGVMTDSQTFTMDGDTAKFLFLDRNGNPVPCENGSMGIAVYTASNALVLRDEVTLEDSGTDGICQAPLSMPLTGVFRVVATFPDRGPRAPVDWLSAFWSTAETQWTRVVPGTTASLFVGSGDYVANASTPTLVAGVDQAPLQMTVSVTDAEGQPVAGLPVTFNVPPELAVTPATATTDDQGFAYATLEWNASPDIAIPQDSQVLYVSATVGGISQVAGSPASIMLRGNASSGRLEGVFENGETSATANGTDSVRLYVRAWDDGVLVENQPERIRVEFSADDNTGNVPNISDAVWDPDNLRYVVTITSNAPVEGGVIIVILTDGEETELELDPVVTFVPGDPVDFVGSSTKVFAIPDEGCANGTRQVADVNVSLLDEYGNWVVRDGAGVVFSLPTGSPLRLLTSTSGLVLVPDVHGQYHIDVTSSRPGTFNVTATLRGNVPDTPFSPVVIPVTFGNNSVDPSASSVTVSSGTKLADGSQSQTVTVKLVSLCGTPMTNLGTDGKDLNLVLTTADGDLSGISTSDFVESPLGTYTASITSTQAGTYDVAVTTTEHANTLSNPSTSDVTTAVTSSPLSVEFVAVPPNAAAPIVQPTNGSLVYGTAEPGVTVRVRYIDSTGVGRIVSGCNAILVPETGIFSCPISPRLADGTVVNVSATGVTGVPSAAVPVIVSAPFATVYSSSVTPGATQVVAGSNFNPGESVTAVVGDNLRTLGPKTAGPDGAVTFDSFTIGNDFSHGTYTVVLTGETTGDVSISFDVLTVPPTPVLNRTNGTLITGTAERELTIRVTANGAPVPGCESVSVSGNGSFSCTPSPKLADNTSVSAVAVDTTGTTSAEATITVHAAYASVATASVAAGSTQQFIGHNFNPGESVTSVVQGTPYSLGPVTADSEGTATFTQFTIGSDAPAGVRTVVLTGQTTGDVTTTFTVTSSTQSASATTTSTSTATSSTSSSSAAPTNSTSSSTATNSPTQATSSTSATSGSTTSTAAPTSATASGSVANPTESTSTSGPTSSTTSPTSGTTSPTSGTTSPTSGSTSPTSGTTSPTGSATSTGATSSTTSATSAPTGQTTSAAANPVAPTSKSSVASASTSIPTGGLADSKVPGLVFFALLIAIGGAILVRIARTSR